MLIETDPAQKQEGTEDGTVLESLADQPDGSGAEVPEDAEDSNDSQEAFGLGKGKKADKQATKEGEEQGEFEILLADEEPDPVEKAPAAPWVKELRKSQRELKAENAELKRQLQGYINPAANDPGPKPTLSDPDVDYDQEKYEAKYDAWKEKVSQKAAADAKAKAEQDAAQASWRQTLAAYETHKTELTKQIPSFPELEAAAQGSLNEYQQGTILLCASNPALVIAALGQKPQLLQELAAEKNISKFTWKVAQLEAKLKMAKKSQVPPPERPLSGGASGTRDATLERLREEASRTGNFTKLNDYKRKLREREGK